MPTDVLIANTDEGQLRLKGNELLLYDDTPGGDPVAVRFRSHNETRGKLSIDAFVNSAWRELGYVGFKADERGRTDPAHRDTLEIEVWCRKPGPSWEDGDYARVFSIRHDGVVFQKPRRIALRAVANGRIVCAEGAGTQPLIANRDAVGAWETFEIIDVP